ncbi:IclR family transcriptional regulator [Oceanispirochaeta crateris]|jgi:DNA-binding IclR family transcriptional regulator|uniref:IclR family transcriptional regulator n=1 Tax=Oceanispirochaeta crateris TaxID=2518645 RepID=A0A5C1QPQ8_9SPIO|nr:IclR family transcriptional regulator [Oceanispirochaeta crateris]QEN09631.1 IclR family transcriptional regulator [Oceanispirochaeta crateris]
MKKSRAAVRTIKILEVIANTSKGLSLSEISSSLDIPITSVSDILKALLDEEMIELLDERSKIYGIGVKAFFIGNTFIANTSLIDKAKGIVEELSDRTKNTVFLGKEVNGKITYIYKYEPKDTLIATCAIGSRTNLHCTSLGKTFLAYDSDLLAGLRGKVLSKITPFTLTDYDALVQEIEKVRIKGFAIDNREQNDHLLCVGSPIFDNNNKIVAALSISGLYRGNEDIEAMGRSVKEASLLISRSLGYREVV